MPNTPIRFTATIASDGRIQPPGDIARQLRQARTVDVEVTLRHADSLLDERAVTSREIEQIMAIQKLETGVVEFVLCGEGSVLPDSALSARLHKLSVIL